MGVPVKHHRIWEGILFTARNCLVDIFRITCAGAKLFDANVLLGQYLLGPNTFISNKAIPFDILKDFVRSIKVCDNCAIGGENDVVSNKNRWILGSILTMVLAVPERPSKNMSTNISGGRHTHTHTSGASNLSISSIQLSSSTMA